MRTYKVGGYVDRTAVSIVDSAKGIMVEYFSPKTIKRSFTTAQNQKCTLQYFTKWADKEVPYNEYEKR